ncbi:glucose-6-phosphate isomerase [Mycoplasma enhydrae]|uniref:glucose-6-phosphate isomerase n=1 Tax=Mycoplasma enhydrae TaxID=2499220 RepID=UPI00197B22FB|nr:glucose-6-phosphate isomerase [Mycoplasma enhydrae]MBN4089322.1 glucose-6-phosphate isomerase [Mycoplasma enhydrae]MCV3733694.1 glucose-6-phosphate isomerase [Mycoplasma enhydrae]MCV3753649.1 glucose-6-phosphate isomerase [Mycoplasma enhydrae]
MAIKNRIEIDCSMIMQPKVIEEKYLEIVSQLNAKINSKEALGQKYLGFFEIGKNIQSDDIQNIKKIVNFLESESIEVFVIVAPKYICLQSEAIINFVYGKFNHKTKLKLLYVDENINGQEMAQLCQYLETKRFAINVISKTGDNIESLLIFRELVLMLIEQLGPKNANQYIFVTTNNNYGQLFQTVQTKKYNHLVLLDNTPEKFLNFSAAVLLPLACAKIDWEAYLDGAKEANEFYSTMPLNKNNSAYFYAVARLALKKAQWKYENIVVNSNSHCDLSRLFAMYLNATSYRKNRGLIVRNSVYPSDAKINSHFFSEKEGKIIETQILLKNSLIDYSIAFHNNFEDDEFSYLVKQTYNQIGNTLNKVVSDNHFTYEVPNIKIYIQDTEAKTLGWLVTFIHRAAIMSAYLMEIDPFEDDGLRTYNIELSKKFTELMGGKKND